MNLIYEKLYDQYKIDIKYNLLTSVFEKKILSLIYKFINTKFLLIFDLILVYYFMQDHLSEVEEIIEICSRANPLTSLETKTVIKSLAHCLKKIIEQPVKICNCQCS